MTRRSCRDPRTISSRRITLAGLKKCRPMTDDGRVGGGGDFVDAQVWTCWSPGSRPAWRRRSSAPSTSFLSARSSNTASMIDVGRVEALPIQLRGDAAQALVDLFLREAAALHRRLVIPPNRSPSPRSIASDVVSCSKTLNPAFAHAIAMPPPMVPAPTIATVLIGDRGDVGRHAGNLRHRAFREKRVDERLALLGRDALPAEIARSR